MEKLDASYETIFVADLQKGEEEVKSLVEKFTKLISDNGTIEETDEWGKRRLAYPINDLTEGYYVLVKFNAPAQFISELERIFGITEGIMRSIVVKAGN